MVWVETQKREIEEARKLAQEQRKEIEAELAQ